MKKPHETPKNSFIYDVDSLSKLDPINIEIDLSNSDEIDDIVSFEDEEDGFSIEQMGDPVCFMEATKFWNKGFGNGSQGWKNKRNWIDLDPRSIKDMTGRNGNLKGVLQQLGSVFKIGRQAYDKYGGEGASKQGFLTFGPYPKYSPSHGLNRLPTLFNTPHIARFTFFIDGIGIPEDETILDLECTSNFGKNVIKNIKITPRTIRDYYKKHKKQERLVAIMRVTLKFNEEKKVYNDFETRIWWTGKGKVIFGNIKVYKW